VQTHESTFHLSPDEITVRALIGKLERSRQ